MNMFRYHLYYEASQNLDLMTIEHYLYGEVYFVQGADGKAIDTLVLHSGGIDNFAVKDRSTLPVVVCGVGHGGWNGMCRGPP